MDETPVNVLLVEDSADDAHIIRGYLSESPTSRFVLTHVETHSAALRHLRKRPADIVLLDLGLPGCQGLSCFATLRAAAPDLPVVVLTSRDDEALAAQALREGAQDCLPKAEANGAVLQRAIRHAIERQANEAALIQAVARERAHADEASALLESERAIIEYRDFSSAAQVIFTACKQLTKASAGFIALAREGREDLDFTFADTGEMPCAADLTAPVMSPKLRERITASRAPIVCNTYPDCEWAAGLPEGHSAVQNVLIAPLFLADSIIGFLCLANKPGGFSEEDARRAFAFGQMAGLALHNSRLLESLKSSEEQFRSVVEHASDAIICADRHGIIISWNHSAEVMFGYAAGEARGQPLGFILPGRHRKLPQKMLGRIVSSGVAQQTGQTIEWTGQRKDGTQFPIELTVSNWNNSEGIFFTAVVRDVSARKRAEAEQRKVNRALRVLTEANHRLVRAAEEAALIRDTCQAAVEVGGYHMAWIGLAGEDKRVRPVAHAGHEDGFLEALSLARADERHGGRPCNRAIRTRRPALIADITRGRRRVAWRDEAVKRGYRSAVSLPLVAEGRALGALTIYAQEPHAFDAEEVSLLMELADDLAYGITALRSREEGRRAEEALRESEARYRALFEASADGILIADVETRGLKYANPTACRMLGYTEEELKGMCVGDIHPKESLQSVMAGFEAQARGDKSLTPNTPCLRKDGSIIHADINATQVAIDGIACNVGFFRDITERKQAEEALQQSYRRVQHALDGTVSALAVAAGWRDPYTAAHEQRVARLAEAIAEEAGLSESERRQIVTAALLHDIGKMAVPLEILSKPGSISQVEFDLIKAHSRVGYEIVAGIDFPWPIADIVLQHHERLDGSGYPDGLCGDQISPGARILGVCDVVEAMSSHRPYRAALGMDAALQEITAHAGLKYDPAVVEACLRAVSVRKFNFD